MEPTENTLLNRSDFIGFDWIFDLYGTLERLLDRIDCHERAFMDDDCLSEVLQ